MIFKGTGKVIGLFIGKSVKFQDKFKMEECILTMFV